MFFIQNPIVRACILSFCLIFQIQACAALPAEADHDSPAAYATSAAAGSEFGTRALLLAHPYARGENGKRGFDDEYKNKELSKLVLFAKRNGFPVFVLKSVEDHEPFIAAEDIAHTFEPDAATGLNHALAERGISGVTIAGYISDALCAEIRMRCVRK